MDVASPGSVEPSVVCVMSDSHRFAMTVLFDSSAESAGSRLVGSQYGRFQVMESTAVVGAAISVVSVGVNAWLLAPPPPLQAETAKATVAAAANAATPRFLFMLVLFLWP
jgi:hypothetical protein